MYSMLPFLQCLAVILISLFIRMTSAIARIFSDGGGGDASTHTYRGGRLLIHGLCHSLTILQNERTFYGTIRACITILSYGALSSLVFVQSVIDCVHVDAYAVDGDGHELIWLLDNYRGIKCYDGYKYWTYVGMHGTVMVIWLVLVVMVMVMVTHDNDGYESRWRYSRIVCDDVINMLTIVWGALL